MFVFILIIACSQWGKFEIDRYMFFVFCLFVFLFFFCFFCFFLFFFFCCRCCCLFVVVVVVVFLFLFFVVFCCFLLLFFCCFVLLVFLTDFSKNRPFKQQCPCGREGVGRRPRFIFWLTFFHSYMLPLFFSGLLSYLVGLKRRTSRLVSCTFFIMYLSSLFTYLP